MQEEVYPLLGAIESVVLITLMFLYDDAFWRWWSGTRYGQSN